jgi:hypothetical protein
MLWTLLFTILFGVTAWQGYYQCRSSPANLVLQVWAGAMTGRFVRALVRVVIDLLARASLYLLPIIPA